MPEGGHERSGGRQERSGGRQERSGGRHERAESPIRRESLSESKGRWVTVIDGHEAEVTYSLVGDSRIIIDHTGVPDALRGQGVGKRLVAQAIVDVREEGRALIPLCPFAKALIARTPEWQDVLA